MRCEEAQDLLVQRSLGEIQRADDQLLELHLARCAVCRSAAVAAERTGELLSGYAEAVALPPQRQAILARLPAARRRRTWLEAAKMAGTAAVAAAMLAGLMGVWHIRDELPALAGRLGGGVGALPSGFLEQKSWGTGYVATALVETPVGKGTAYLYVEPASGGRIMASVLFRDPKGRLTRDVMLGTVSFGGLPFSQPEFRLLTAGERQLLGVITDGKGNDGELRVIAYNPSTGRLGLVPFGSGKTTVSVSGWPVATDEGIRTQSPGRVHTWTPGENGELVLRGEGAAPAPESVWPELSREPLSLPGGAGVALLRGTLADGAALYLRRPDGSETLEVDLGKPHFGNLDSTRPGLRVVRAGQKEFLLILSDPMVSLPGQAVVRAYAYDPELGRIRLVPFATGEVTVETIPAPEGEHLLTRQVEVYSKGLRLVERRWRLTGHWLLEEVSWRVVEDR